MVSLNDYLYNGDTILKVLHNFDRDLNIEGIRENDELDLVHCEMLEKMIDILERNDFLTSQSQRIREFYKYMTSKFPFLAFTFKGRIKSVIRMEEKLNGYIINYFNDYYEEFGKIPPIEPLKEKLRSFRDIIAYRIIISIPKCHLEEDDNKEEVELYYLYKIANALPDFLEQKEFRIIEDDAENKTSSHLNEDIRMYYRDYIEHPSSTGYQSLHITLYDEQSNSYLEVQIRTKEMDDYAEIGMANHKSYEKIQKNERTRNDQSILFENPIYKKAFERYKQLQELDVSKVDVNMFGAINRSLVNDGCGLLRGRLILPLEHLSHYQNDIID